MQDILKSLSGEISAQNIPYDPVCSAGFAGCITLSLRSTMSLDFDWLYKLSNPAFTLGISAPIIGIAALGAFCAIRSASDTAKWRNRISFAAEILVIVGVVGIFAYVGRARNDILTAESIRDVKDAEYAQAVDSNRLKQTICAEHRLSKAKVLDADTEACEKFGDAQRMFNIDSSLEFLARDYKRISEIPSLSANKVKLLTDAAKSTWAFVEARNAKALHEHRQREANSRLSWHLVFGIALLVCVGVGFKCGRAAADLWPRT